MFGSIGLPEVLMILVIALLIFGPKRLPEIGRTIGKGLAEFRRASSDIKRTVNAELALDEDEAAPMARRPSVATPKVTDGSADAPAPAPAKASEPPSEPVASAVAEKTIAREKVEEAESSAGNESSVKAAPSAEPSAGPAEATEPASGDAAASR